MSPEKIKGNINHDPMTKRPPPPKGQQPERINPEAVRAKIEAMGPKEGEIACTRPAAKESPKKQFNEADPNWITPIKPFPSHCNGCNNDFSAEYIAPVWFNRKPMAGTGVWLPGVFEDTGLCFSCTSSAAAKKELEETEKLWKIETDKRLNQCGFYPKHRKMSFDTFKIEDGNKTAAAKAAALASGEPLNLFLCGPVGCGKTHLAAAALRERITKGKQGKFLIVPELLLNMRSRFQKVSELELLDEIHDNDCLVLDDFGAEKVSEWVMQTFYTIFNRWELDERTGMIITSNLTLEEIEHNVGPRIASRISGSFTAVKMTGANKRSKLI